jgi:hypothetical protein
MRRAADAFDPKSVRPGELAGMAGPPPEAE